MINYIKFASCLASIGYEGSKREAFDYFDVHHRGVIGLQEMDPVEYRLLTKFFLELFSRFNDAEIIWGSVLNRKRQNVLQRASFLEVAMGDLTFEVEEAQLLFQLLDLDQAMEITYENFLELYNLWKKGGAYDVTEASMVLRQKRRMQILTAEFQVRLRGRQSP